MRRLIEAGTRFLAGRKRRPNGDRVTGVDLGLVFSFEVSRFGGNRPCLSEVEAAGQVHSPKFLGRCAR